MTVVPLLARLVDRAAGAPPPAAHPVVWMGRLLDACAARGRPDAGARAEQSAGAAARAGGCVLVAALALPVARACRRRLPLPVGAALEAVALSTLLSARVLRREVAATEEARACGLAPARRLLAGPVSCDTADLDEEQIPAAALESLAENASESMVAPLYCYARGHRDAGGDAVTAARQRIP